MLKTRHRNFWARWRGTLESTCLPILLAIALAVAPRPVGAQSPPATPPVTPEQPTAPANPEAQRHLQRGQTLAADGRHQEALQAFRSADAIERNPASLRGIAESNEALGNPAGAHAAYSELLKLLASSGGDPAERARITQKLTELEARTGQLRINVGEPNARVEVNGQFVGTTPLPETVRLSNGVYTVSIRKAGFAEFRQQVTLNHDEATILGPLVPEPTEGSLSVRERTGQPARLFIDGKEMGPLPWRGSLGRGQHLIEARGAGSNVASQTLRFERADHKELVLELVARPAKLTVTSASGVDEIRVDGQLVGRGRWAGDVTPGQHRIEITRTDALPFARDIDAAPGAVIDVSGGPTPVPSAKTSDHEREREEDKSEHGLYLRLSLQGEFGTSNQHDLSTDKCKPASSSGSCDSSNPLGLTTAGRIGYRFGIVGVEGFGHIGDLTVSTAKVTYADRSTSGSFDGAKRVEDYALLRYGLSVGGALRFTTPTPGVRLSAGAGGGVAWRNVRWGRTVTPDSTYLDKPIADSSDVASYLAPLLVFDAALGLGSSPGVQLFFGANLMVEFTPETAVPGKDGLALGFERPVPPDPPVHIPLESPEIVLARGTQIYWGPIAGLHFGY